jgi:mannose/cellobiose epimerase-like protein (N-acyl-D-glucosamine 2-epimerase family)
MRIRSRLPRHAPPIARYRTELPAVTAASARESLERLLVDNLLGFWDEQVIDPRGGYRLAYDVRGRRRRDPRRHLVTQARTLWFYSRMARSPYGEPEHLEWATHGFGFLRERLWDQNHGGLFWAVDATGPTDDRKHLYGQAFGLLALAEFHRAAADESARELAQELFELIDRRAHDARFGGYTESWTREWREEPAGDTNPAGLPPGEKTVNGHMHWMSALAALVEVAPADRPSERLRELVTILGELGGGGSAGYSDRHREDWSPVPGWRSSYGHDVEVATLSMQACGVLGISDTSLLSVWRALWENTLEYGFDRQRSGLYQSGGPGRPADRLEKVWWVQAEGLLGAKLMHTRTGDRRYEVAFLRILDWIVRGQADWERGDWHRVVAPDGTVTGDKAGAWECPFHQGRALLECLAAMPGTPSSG